jgi:hypothetical protein
MNGLQMLRLHAVAKHSFVVRIGFHFGTIGSLGPTSQGSFYAFHFHVGAFDDADGHWCTAALDTLHCPLGYLLLHESRVGHIGLQCDATLDFFQPFSGEGLHEDLSGETQVAILFHVEVDEFGDFFSVGADEGFFRCGSVEEFQSVGNYADGVFA